MVTPRSGQTAAAARAASIARIERRVAVWRSRLGVLGALDQTTTAAPPSYRRYRQLRCASTAVVRPIGGAIMPCGVTYVFTGESNMSTAWVLLPFGSWHQLEGLLAPADIFFDRYAVITAWLSSASPLHKILYCAYEGWRALLNRRHDERCFEEAYAFYTALLQRCRTMAHEATACRDLYGFFIRLREASQHPDIDGVILHAAVDVAPLEALQAFQSAAAPLARQRARRSSAASNALQQDREEQTRPAARGRRIIQVRDNLEENE